MTSSDLQLVKLSEIASFKYGKTIRKSEVHESEGYPVHSGYQVVGYLPNYMYQEPQLLIVCRGAGGTGDVKISPAKCSITNLAIVISCDLSKVDMGYLYWRLLLSDTYSLRTGSAQPQITINTLDSFEILIEPSILKQKEIAKHLFLLNEKIETNNQINQTLEQMAQAIFKSWFVDFEPVKAKIAALEAGGSEDDALLAAMQVISGKDPQQLTQLQTENPEHYTSLRATAELFPAAMQESELGEIPEGWGAGELSSVAVFASNRISTEELSHDTYVSTENMLENKGGICNASSLPSAVNVPAFEPKQILVSNIRPYFKKIWFANYSGGRSPDVLGFESKHQGTSEFLYNLIYQDQFFDYMMLTSKGAKMPRGDKDAIMQFALAVPPAELMKCFSQRVEVFYNLINMNRLGSKSLSELRDTLLPKLLSGELFLADLGGSDD